MEPAPTPTNNSASNSYGSVLSILLIVLVLVLGAFYVWNKRINEERPQNATPDAEVVPTASVDATLN